MAKSPDRPELILFFRNEERPDAQAIRAAMAQLPGPEISHDPETQHGLPADWLEILIDGLTFDLVGLSDGSDSPAGNSVSPALQHYLDCDASDLSGTRHIKLVPGPHLTSARLPLPVARSMMRLGMMLGEHLPGLIAFGWPPSGAVTGRSTFLQMTENWIKGGPFPALGLVTYQIASDGTLESRGLSLFSGQELRLSPALVAQGAGAMRLAVRIAHDIAGQGTLEEKRHFSGPDGMELMATPDSSGRWIEVGLVQS